MFSQEFSNRLVGSLPADPLANNRRSRAVRGAAFSWIEPEAVANPSLLDWAGDVADLLGLPKTPDPSLAAEVFSGNKLWPGMKPHALCYGGHQFGIWADQLGDGRAICLGEVPGPDGEHWEVQLKGAGKTPYSRFADGRAVLRSSIREYVCSEAMHHLGVPTTRALCLVGTGEGVVRDMFYNGQSKAEPGAIVTRVAPSFLRFGSLEMPAFRQDSKLLQQTLDFVLRHYYPHLGEPSKDSYLAWYDEICQRTCDLIVHWMRVGFVHGVMNTDNLSLLGLTLDYGPYGWLDSWNPEFTPNTSDAQGRYSYANQPHCAAWNLACLGNSLAFLMGNPRPITDILHRFQPRYEEAYQLMMADKLGLPPDSAHLSDLMARLKQGWALVETDYTLFFRALMALEPESSVSQLCQSLDCFYRELEADDRQYWERWLGDYLAAVKEADEPVEARQQRMAAANPLFIPRNFLVQEVIQAAEAGDFDLLHRIMDRLKSPYQSSPEDDTWVRKRPDWALRTAGCSALSCSS